jgi:hypothetical protein
MFLTVSPAPEDRSSYVQLMNHNFDWTIDLYLDEIRRALDRYGGGVTATM